MHVYIAMNSNPDWYSPGPTFKSVHKTLDGAIRSLYPEGRYDFRPSSGDNNGTTSWVGPDGFGFIRLVTLED